MINKQKCLFLFTIGPVQSFISQARKTQDLYAGSQLLSKLVEAGINAVPNLDKEKDLIYPYLDNSMEKSLPNRFVVIIEDKKENLRKIGESIENGVRTKFKKIANESLGSSKKPVGFDKQINRHLDIHWVFHPLDGSDYKENYKAAEALLGSVKNVRPFEQYGTVSAIGEAGRKCSLDGEDNALFFGAGTSKRFFNKKWNPFASELEEEQVYISKNEGLSAVSFTKRFDKSNASFPSTAEIAVLYDEKSLKSDKKQIFSCYQKLFSNKKDALEVCIKMINNKWVKNIQVNKLGDEDKWNRHFDYQPLFEENLSNKTIPHRDQLKLAKILQSKLASSFKTKYYALILFDGDKMGEKLSNAKSPIAHREFSKLLAGFAKKARTILKDKGQTIYAGGDDFLGFVNLHYLFEVMDDLRKEFRMLVSDKAQQILGIQEEFTFSAGIVVAHYKTPLSEVLKIARKIEKKAKNDGNRNAFCITAIRHSGEIQEAVLKWGDVQNLTNNWKALHYITQQLGKGIFSNKFIINLTIELYQLAGVALNDVGIDSNAITIEFKRLLKRALIKQKDKTTNEKRINDMAEKLEILYKNSRKMGTRTKNFVHALQIADFLSRKVNKS